MNAAEGPDKPGGGGDKPRGKLDVDASKKHVSDTSGDTASPTGSDNTGAEPLNEHDALAMLRGESTSRQDVARSMEIIARRLKILEESDLRIGTVNLFNAGVKVGGDLNTGVGGSGSGRARSRPETVELAHIVDYTTAYVTPDGFGDALAVLRGRHLLVLSAGPGTGRDAAVFALLQKVLDKDATVRRLSDTVVAGESWAVPSSATGFVALDSSGATAALLDDAWLLRVSEQLRGKRSYLVVVTGALTGKLAVATRRAEYVVESLVAPDPVAVVRSRTVHMGAIADDEVDARLTEWRVQELLAERPRPRFAVQVALAIVDALSTRQDVAAAIERLRDPLGQVHEWFGEHEDPKHIAFAVATAVLEESSYLTVSDAAVDLFDALAEEQPSPPPLRYRRGMQIDQPWIELVQGSDDSSAGVPAGVRFRSPRVQPVVLDFVWNELDGMRPALYAWLRRMVTHADVEVRARAATAAGMLAAQDFQYALHRFIVPWASSSSFVTRHSAAVALSVVGAAPEHTERVWALLRQWTSEVHLAGRKRLAATAGSVAGLLGVAEPRRALKVLRELVEEDDWALLEPVVLSIFQLIDGGRSAEILDALLDWTDAQDHSQLVVKGLTAFLFTVREQAIASAEEELGAPELPELLTGVRTYPAQLSELWGRGLACRPVRTLALEALREWVRAADRNSRAHPVLLYLLGEIADRGQRDFERLHYHLDRWANDTDPSPAAGRLRDALSDSS